MSIARSLSKFAKLLGSDGKVPPSAVANTGTLQVPAVRVNGGADYSWANTLFSSVVKGSGDGGTRTLAVIGGVGSGASFWMGSTTSPHAALDSAVGGGIAFWANNGSSWRSVYSYNYDGAFVINSNGGTPSWSCPLVSGTEFHLHDQYFDRWKSAFNRAWENYPCITVENDTRYGPQGEFRIHGASGYSGGDISTAVRADGGFITGSDRRRKANIQPIPNALQRVLALEGSVFNVRNSQGEIETDLSSADGLKFGFVAQDAHEVIPEATKFYPESDTPNEHGWASAYSIDYASVVPLLVEAIKEQQQIIEQLKERVANLESV